MKNALLSLALVFASTGALAGNPSWPTNSGSIGSAASGATLDDSAGPIIDAVSTATCPSGWYVDVDRDAVKDADEPCVNPKYTHATDCTALTIGILGDTCFEQDSAQLFECEPSAGGCDSAAEWKRITGGRIYYLSPSDDVPGTINAAPEYSTFYLVPNGVYDLTAWSGGINMKTGQTLDGRGAIITGAHDMTPGTCTWTHTVGPPEYWSCSTPDYPTTHPSDPNTCSGVYTSAPYSHGNNFCKDGILWVYPNTLVDNTVADFTENGLAKAGNKARVEGLTELDDATDPLDEFYWSLPSNLVVLKYDPAGMSVVSNSGFSGGGGTTPIYAIRMGAAPFTGSRSNSITVKNLTVQFLASTPHNNGAIHTGRCDNCVIDNVRVRFNQGNGIACFQSNNFELKNSLIEKNTNVGYQGCWESDREEVHDNVIRQNGIGGYEPTFGTGNVKLAWSLNSHLYRNKITDAGLLTGRTTANPAGEQEIVEGLWMDSNGSGFLFENNYIARNGNKGIYSEVSCNGVIRGNHIYANRYGLIIGDSHDIVVTGNFFESNFNQSVQIAKQGRTNNFTVQFGSTSPCPGGDAAWNGTSNDVEVSFNAFEFGNSNTTAVNGVWLAAGLNTSDNITFHDNCYDVFRLNNYNPARAWVVADYDSSGLPNTWYTFAQWQSTFGMDTGGVSRQLFEYPGGCRSGQDRSNSYTAEGHSGNGSRNPSDGD